MAGASTEAMDTGVRSEACKASRGKEKLLKQTEKLFPSHKAEH